MKSWNICHVSVRSLQPSHVNPGCLLLKFLRSLCKSMMVKSKLKWRHQDAGDAKTMEGLPRKAGHPEWNWPKGVAMCGAGRRVGEVKPAKAPPGDSIPVSGS